MIPKLFSARITWEDVDWLRRVWPRKLIIKGILSVADAQRAAAHGCDGIVLTNHGGRQMDHCVSGLDMLPEIAQAVGERLTLILDGGIRRGTDVIKAVALGADAVILGRAPLYGWRRAVRQVSGGRLKSLPRKSTGRWAIWGATA